MENLTLWSERMMGAKLLLLKFRDYGVNMFPKQGKDGKIYSTALYECLLDSKSMDKFLCGGTIRFFDHVSKMGKLISCKAKIE